MCSPFSVIVLEATRRASFYVLRYYSLSLSSENDLVRHRSVEVPSLVSCKLHNPSSSASFIMGCYPLNGIDEAFFISLPEGFRFDVYGIFPPLPESIPIIADPFFVGTSGPKAGRFCGTSQESARKD